MTEQEKNPTPGEFKNDALREASSRLGSTPPEAGPQSHQDSAAEKLEQIAVETTDVSVESEPVVENVNSAEPSPVESGEISSKPSREEMIAFIAGTSYYNAEQIQGINELDDEQLPEFYDQVKSFEEKNASSEDIYESNIAQSEEHPESEPTGQAEVAPETEPNISNSNIVEENVAAVSPEEVRKLSIELDPNISITAVPNEIQRLNSAAELALERIKKGKLSIKFGDRNDPELKSKMLANVKPESDPEEWKQLGDFERNLEQEYGIKIVRAFKDPQEQYQAFQNLKSALDLMDFRKYHGKSFKVGATTDPRSRDHVMIDPEWSSEDIFEELDHSLPIQHVREKKPKQSEPAGEIELDKTDAEPKGPTQLDDEDKQQDLDLEFDKPYAPKFGARDGSDIKESNEEDKQKDLPLEFDEPYNPKFGSREHKDRQPKVDSIPLPTPEEIKENLDTARRLYVIAKRKHDDFSALRTLREKTGISIKGDALKESEEGFAKAKAEYEKSRAEYMGADIERYLLERRALVASHIEEYGDSGNKFKEFYNWYKKVANISLMDTRLAIHAESNNAKKVLKAVNVRSVIGLALFAGGTILGATTVGGATAFAVRRGLGAMGSGSGTKEMLEGVRAGRKSAGYTTEQIQTLKLDEVESRLSQIESIGFFDGKNLDEITSQQEHADLTARYKQLLESEAPQTDREDYLKSRMGQNEDELHKSRRKEVIGRRATTAAAIGVGAIVGSGAISKLAGKLPGIKNPFAGPEFVTLNEGDKADLLFQGKPTGGFIEVKGGETLVHVGNRGLEGALNDLKRADPEKYSGMMHWIREQYPGTKSTDGSLIHRVVEKLAQNNGYTLGGNVNDITRVEAATFRLIPLESGDFAVKLDANSVDLTDPPIPEAEAEPVLRSSESINVTPEPEKVVSDGMPESVEDTESSEAVESGDAPEVVNLYEPQPQPEIPPQDAPETVAAEDAPEIVQLDQELDVPKGASYEAPAALETGAEVKIGPDEIKVEELDFNELKPQSVNEIGSVSAQAEVRLHELEIEKTIESVQNLPNTSDALKEVLGRDFKPFREEVYDFDAGRLKLIQNERVSKFIDVFNNDQTPPKFIKLYTKLYKHTNELLAHSTPEQAELIKSSTIRDLLLRLAAERKHS